MGHASLVVHRVSKLVSQTMQYYCQGLLLAINKWDTSLVVHRVSKLVSQTLQYYCQGLLPASTNGTRESSGPQ
ncbi:hypothetical protein J6590_060032, partial [Homalodisca vitripennis]